MTARPYACVEIDGAPSDIEIRFILEVRAVRVDTRAEHIELDMMVTERETAKIESFTTRYPFTRELRESMARDLDMSAEYVTAAFVRETLRAAVLHEADESFFVGGKLIFDPHRHDAEGGG